MGKEPSKRTTSKDSQASKASSNSTRQTAPAPARAPSDPPVSERSKTTMQPEQKKEFLFNRRKQFHNKFNLYLNRTPSASEKNGSSRTLKKAGRCLACRKASLNRSKPPLNRWVR